MPRFVIGLCLALGLSAFILQAPASAQLSARPALNPARADHAADDLATSTHQIPSEPAATKPKTFVWFSDSMDPSVQAADDEWISEQVIEPVMKASSVKYKNTVTISVPGPSVQFHFEEPSAVGTPYCAISVRNLATVLVSTDSSGGSTRANASAHLTSGARVSQMFGIHLNLFARELSSALNFRKLGGSDKANKSLSLARAHMKLAVAEIGK